jgi:hypothetical protein
MANAQQVDPTPVVLTRRDSVKRGAAALAKRRKEMSPTMTMAASVARANATPATISKASRSILTPSMSESSGRGPGNDVEYLDASEP